MLVHQNNCRITSKGAIVQKFNNILLFGGETKNENMPVGFYSSLALLPLRGKPIIWWQLENLKKYGIENCIIVVCNNNRKLIEYCKNILSQNFKIKLVKVESHKNILSSLKYGLQKADTKLPTRVILGDTLILDSINDETDVLFTSTQITTSENWCLVDKGTESGLNFIDKEIKVPLKDKEALVGYYTFSDTKYLLNCCIRARLLLKKEISTALSMYQEKYPLKTKLVGDWYDLGHTSGLIKLKNILFSARDFNAISVDTTLGTLTKSSTKVQKLEDEAYWFNNLPEELKIATPRLISFKKNEDKAQLTQELYGYPSLQELYLSGEVNIEDWSYILEKLFGLHKTFEKYTTNENEQALLWLYCDKTAQRIEELKQQKTYWQRLFAEEKITINGVNYKGIRLLRKNIEQYAKNISKNVTQTIIHGDYCFSNILFDSSNYMFKLIDPRGRLNRNATIYGDPRYDIAKLRHSVCGLYDFIVQGLFKISEKNKSFEYDILTTKDYTVLEKVFDNFTVQNGYKPKDIKFIEGLLFLSMIPLHKDNFNRQKMFYLRAVELLNSVLSVENKENENGRKEVANLY